MYRGGAEHGEVARRRSRTGSAWPARAAARLPRPRRGSGAPASARRLPRAAHRVRQSSIASGTSSSRWPMSCSSAARISECRRPFCLRKVGGLQPVLGHRDAFAEVGAGAARLRRWRGSRRRGSRAPPRASSRPQQCRLAVDAVAGQVAAAQVARVTAPRRTRCARAGRAGCRRPRACRCRAGAQLEARLAQQRRETPVGGVEGGAWAARQRPAARWSGCCSAPRRSRRCGELDQRTLGVQLGIAASGTGTAPACA